MSHSFNSDLFESDIDILKRLIESVPSGYVTANWLSNQSGIDLQTVKIELEQSHIFKKSLVQGPDGQKVYMIRGSKSWLLDAWIAFKDINYRYHHS